MASLLTNTKLGNTGVSSLVKSAQTLSNELNTYSDTIKRLTFENSAKTQSDLEAYQRYLNGRIKNLESTGAVTDATKALDMRQTLTSAIHSAASADIQRSTIAVLDGQATPDQKLAAIGRAFQRLYAVGDLAAAQSYEQQYYSYSQTVQYQKQQAADALASAARSASSAYSSAVTAAEDTIKNNIRNANAAFAAQGPAFLDKATNSYLKSQSQGKSSGSASIFAALAGQVGMVKKGIQLNDRTKYSQGTYTPGSMLDIYTQAIIANPDKAASYKSKIDSYLNGETGVPLPGEGNKSLTYNALMNTVYAGNSNLSPYAVTRGVDGSWQIKEEHVTGYLFGKDMNGAVKLMPAYSLFNTPIPKETQSVLEKAGINVKSDSNGDWWFQATNQGSFIGRVLGNYPVQGAVQKDGTVEFMGNKGELYKMVKGSNGLYGIQQLNAFGQVTNPNVAGQYGFKPPANQTIVNKGSTNFMTKVLGDTATPNIQGNKVTYQANGKTYQLVTDSKGLKGLQEIDSSGKVINSNVAGQYGFNPNSLSKDSPYDGTHTPATQFVSSLVNGSLVSQNLKNDASNPNFHAPGSLYGSTPQWLGVSQLINNGLVMQSINEAHNQTMLALQAQATQRRLAFRPLPAPQPIKVAPAPPQPHLNVAQSSPHSLGNKTMNPQQTIPGVSLQGGNVNLQGGNVNLQGGGIRLQ